MSTRHHDAQGAATGRTPNGDRSDSMNPNNDAYEASGESREEQLVEND